MDAETDGCDAAEPEVICPREMPGTNEIASTIGNHRQCSLARSRFRPALKSNRSSNTDLIIIETEKIDRTEVLAVEIIDTGAPISGDQHVKRRFDKIVVIIPRCTHSIERVEIIVRDVFKISRRTIAVGQIILSISLVLTGGGKCHPKTTGE